ncbi:MAG: tRNA (adenosine(37)-N6)-threonylcarbamoyltransferase complex dimerization subunit type 1 TsaB [Christensenellales bacterium]|jgi:tRNA threonylcarbamoyladenosine biosynthesis protein TsaB
MNTMNILALDTSAAAASVAIMREERLICEVYLNRGLTHSQVLMKLVDDALDAAGLHIKEIGAIACSVGPGSFTGVRIGVAAARGLSTALGVGAVGVNTLDALAYNAAGLGRRICSLMDAKREQVYCAVYENDDFLQPVVGYAALGLEQAVARGGAAVYVGDAAHAYRGRILDWQPGACFLPEGHNLQRSCAVAALASEKLARGGGGGANDLTPFYLRRPQAERERLAREEKA